MDFDSFGRTLLRGALALSLTAAVACGSNAGTRQPAERTTGGAPAATPADAPLAVVYKSPTCGCCNAWVDHMRQSGFRVETHDTDNVDQVKNESGVPQNARSCHTAKVGAYAIEGHVPADLVKRLLQEHPADIAGLAVPGMVTGSPGMEGPNPQHYDVIAFHKDGTTSVYASR
ncbi:MAG TPA: DUF411 domain-containing protein [Longimicrobiaceae bacterium]